MLQWMEAGGTRGALPPAAKIEVRDDLGACKCIRGVAATQDIKMLETIFEIPVSLRITSVFLSSLVVQSSVFFALFEPPDERAFCLSRQLMFSGVSLVLCRVSRVCNRH